MNERTSSTSWNHRGARALTILHERELRAFLATWHAARAAGLRLPTSDDPNYASLETLLHHVLRAARGYIRWTAETLRQETPALPETPALAQVTESAEAFIDAVCATWSVVLADVTEEQADQTVAQVAWGPPYCVDALLEHAVMHPLRHRFQLEELASA